MKLKKFFGQKSYFLVLAALLLAILSGIEFERQAQKNAEVAAEQIDINIED